MESRTRRGFENHNVSSIHLLAAGDAEVEGIGHFLHGLPVTLAPLLPFVNAPLPLNRGLFRTLRKALLKPLFLLYLLVSGKRMVVALHQAPVR